MALEAASKTKTEASAHAQRLREQLGEEAGRFHKVQAELSELLASKATVDADLGQHKLSVAALKKQVEGVEGELSQLKSRFKQENARADAAAGSATRLQVFHPHKKAA